MKKVDFTVQEYGRVLRGTHLDTYFRSVGTRMSEDVKNVLQNTNWSSEQKYVSGEMALWDLLTANGVEEILAAELAVEFPYPIEFDPGLRGNGRGLRKFFDEEVKSGKNPLDVLIKAAEIVVQKPFFSQPELKLKKFTDYVKERELVHQV